jgi:hypothetical protein
MDHDGDRADRDGDHRHPDQDGPDTAASILDDGANHEHDFGGKDALRQPRILRTLSLFLGLADWNAPLVAAGAF